MNFVEREKQVEQFWKDVIAVQASVGDNDELWSAFCQSIRRYYHSMYVPFIIAKTNCAFS